MTMNMREIARYLAVGGVCAASQNAIIIGLTWTGRSYLLANILSAAVFVPLGYLLQSFFTFRVSPSINGLARFVIGVAAGLPLSSALLWITHGLCGIPIEIGSPLVTVLMTVYGFTVARWVSQKRSRRPISGALRSTIQMDAC
jgi:putative flippase GtrA